MYGIWLASEPVDLSMLALRPLRGYQCSELFKMLFQYTLETDERTVIQCYLS